MSSKSQGSVSVLSGRHSAYTPIPLFGCLQISIVSSSLHIVVDVVVDVEAIVNIVSNVKEKLQHVSIVQLGCGVKQTDVVVVTVSSNLKKLLVFFGNLRESWYPSL